VSEKRDPPNFIRYDGLARVIERRRAISSRPSRADHYPKLQLARLAARQFFFALGLGVRLHLSRWCIAIGISAGIFSPAAWELGHIGGAVRNSAPAFRDARSRTVQCTAGRFRLSHVRLRIVSAHDPNASHVAGLIDSGLAAASHTSSEGRQNRAADPFAAHRARTLFVNRACSLGAGPRASGNNLRSDCHLCEGGRGGTISVNRVRPMSVNRLQGASGGWGGGRPLKALAAVGGLALSGCDRVATSPRLSFRGVGSSIAAHSLTYQGCSVFASGLGFARCRNIDADDLAAFFGAWFPEPQDEGSEGGINLSDNISRRAFGLKIHGLVGRIVASPSKEVRPCRHAPGEARRHDRSRAELHLQMDGPTARGSCCTCWLNLREPPLVVFHSICRHHPWTGGDSGAESEGNPLTVDIVCSTPTPADVRSPIGERRR